MQSQLQLHVHKNGQKSWSDLGRVLFDWKPVTQVPIFWDQLPVQKYTSNKKLVGLLTTQVFLQLHIFS